VSRRRSRTEHNGARGSPELAAHATHNPGTRQAGCRRFSMNDDVISILQCPITKCDLRAMTSIELRQLNERASAGDLFHVDGTQLNRAVTAGLIASDGSFAYLVEDDIALMLSDLAIPMTRDAREKTRGSQFSAQARAQFSAEKRSVQTFYNEIGWQDGDK